jgi:hypothetical protein
MLARASQRSNVKLRDLAGHIAEGTMSVDEAR